MKKLFQLLLLAFFVNAYSQTKTASTDFETKRTDIEQLAYSDPEEAFVRSQVILDNATKSGNLSQLAKAESTMALVKIYLTAIDEAIKLNDQSLAFHQTANDSGELAKNHFNRALISERQSDYVNSIRHFLKAISFAEKSKDYVLIQKSYRGLSMSYCDQKNFDKALEFATKSLAYQKLKTDSTQKGYTLGALAEIYRLKGNLNLANQYFKKAYDLFMAIGNEHGIAWVLTNWSLCYENDLLKLTEKELEVQQIWDRIAPENTMSIMNLGNIALNYYLIAKDDSLVDAIKNPKMPKGKTALLKESEKYYIRCLDIADRKKNLNAILNHGYNYSLLLYDTQKYKECSDNLRNTLFLNDSIYSQQNKNKIAALESEKKILVRDEKIRLDKLTLANKEKQKWYLITGLVLLAIIGGLLFKQSRNRKKSNEKLLSLNDDLDQKNAALDKANKTNARFFSILNHDLRSPVYNLIHFLHLQKDSPELLDSEMKSNIESKNIAAAENLLQSMEDLLLWSKSQMENFSPHFEETAVGALFEDLKNHFSGFGSTSIRFENPGNVHLNTDENYLKTIMRNLTGNAIKALAETENPIIIWKAWRENGQYFLSISDNGPGGKEEQFRALYDDTEVIGIQSGLGLHLIRDLAKAIRCRITIGNGIDSGIQFVLSFPIAHK